MHLIQKIEKELSGRTLPDVRVGDTVEVHYLIREGEKERVQLFVGTLIGLRGRGIRRSITVRRIVQGEGVERIFPLFNPRVQEVVTRRRGETRRAKLYYLRERVGKQTRLKELLGDKTRAGAVAGELEESSTDSAGEPAQVEGQPVEV